MEVVNIFYQLSVTYCQYIVENEITYDSISDLMELVMKLYMAALKLPQEENVSFEETHPARIYPQSLNLGKGFKTMYWQVFDPFTLEEPVCCSIRDDMLDIANDLLTGIAEYNAGRKENAVFEWRLSFESHWGTHAVDLMHALHFIRVGSNA